VAPLSASAVRAATATAAPHLSPLSVTGCWEWLLSACSCYPQLLTFVSQVPAFADAVRSSPQLDERPAIRAIWLLLLAADEAGTSQKPSGHRGPCEGSLLGEAMRCVKPLLAGERGGEGEAERWQASLTHSLELLRLMRSSANALRPLLERGGPAGRTPLLAELEAFQARARAEGAAAADAVAAAEAVGDKPTAGAEKRAGLLVRAGPLVKQLLQAVDAPGKGD